MSLTSDDLADIKHLIEVSISAAMKMQMKEIRQEFDRVDKRFDAIDKRFEAIDERFEDMDMKLDTILDAVGTEFNDQQAVIDDHEKRLLKLEKKAA